ncbi:MAG: ferredoxin-type protein NapG [Thiobacillaceae bacterium]|nr:ferredoxin-type protein NapG [Thiobacillaceae bacterium]MCX7673541.1 ferredoxin-type protein NapG [Thiobacillaceae bacterium]MDW8324259.1 ferredoxin-type protein NapG [Burkholderiales bacterium]
MTAPANAGRRVFLVRLTQGAALAASGGLVWTYVLRSEARASPFALRPPGALAEPDFNALCIKCGQCVNACPYDTLRLATAWDSRPIGSPYFLPRETPCYMCTDIPCLKACPTGALSPQLKDIRDARMGLAVIDIENCLSWNGMRCEICYLTCPVRGRAITVERRTGPEGTHARLVPIVHSDHCTGCGVCEKKCPTQEAAIKVVQADLVKGDMGEHYRLMREGITPGAAPPAPAVPPAAGPDRRPAVPGLDVLNQGL